MSATWHSDEERCHCRHCHGTAYVIKGHVMLSNASGAPLLIDPIACLEACPHCSAWHEVARAIHGLHTIAGPQLARRKES